ncbi:MAG: nicotinamidase-related amidase [Myxococcota bacterium]|jgi:nicotinamidase-related amidase
MNHLSDSFRADSTHSAVLLVDLQVDFLSARGRLPVAQSAVPPLLEWVEAVVAEAHEIGVRVVHIVNRYPRWSIGNLFRKFAAIEDSPGAEIDERVPQTDADPVFTKTRADAFSNPELHTWIREHGIERLLVMGVYADACVRRTVEGALARGIAVTVPRQAVASRSDAAVDRGLRAITRAGATTR